MPNNDYILRRDVLNEFHEWIVSNDGNIFSLADALEAIPATAVEPVRHGKWIDENPASPLDPRMRCSICGHVEVPMWMWRFCPVCGAKMNAEPPKEERDD